jgi:hypothetical protein
MKPILLLLALIAAGCVNTRTVSAPANSAGHDRQLLIDASSMPLTLGSATLIIGNLQRANGVYAGDYHIQVFPYFLKSDQGRIAIIVPDESLAAVRQGKVTQLSGTAVSEKKSIPTLQIDVVATPAGTDEGRLKIQFQVGGRKMVFEPAYHFVENQATLALNRTMNAISASLGLSAASLNP